MHISKQFQGKSSRYANVNYQQNEYVQGSRNTSEIGFDEITSNKHLWITSSGPGSLSDKYRGVDLPGEDHETERSSEISKNKLERMRSKSKSPLPIRDDGIITTISRQEEQTHDDQCSSVISLSDKYRTQEEIEIFQV